MRANGERIHEDVARNWSADRLFASDTAERAVARELHAHVASLPLICPHSHIDVRILAENTRFADPAQLLVVPDHYVTRMLYSAGVKLEDIGVRAQGQEKSERSSREIWRTLADHWHWFRGTPSRLWIEHTLYEVFGIKEEFGPATCDEIFDSLTESLALPEFRPRALYDRFGIEVLATTEDPTDTLDHHRALAATEWGSQHRVITTFRPDLVVDFEKRGWSVAIERLAEVSGKDTSTYAGYLEALRQRREVFRAYGATATDHGHPTASTYELQPARAAELYDRALRGRTDAADAELFRGHMLMVFAEMSIDDGMVMQLHPGSSRNHNEQVFETFGPDMGADIPAPTNYVEGLRPLLNRFGNDSRLTLIVFTLDESTMSRELAPLAGHYPAMRLGPAWWFFDSPDGMLRYRELVTETAGFYNTVGFNDDARAFPSIIGRHDVSRRVDASFLARLVIRHRLSLDEAHEVAEDLAYNLPKNAYRL